MVVVVVIQKKVRSEDRNMTALFGQPVLKTVVFVNTVPRYGFSSHGYGVLRIGSMEYSIRNQMSGLVVVVVVRSRHRKFKSNSIKPLVGTEGLGHLGDWASGTFWKGREGLAKRPAGSQACWLRSFRLPILLDFAATALTDKVQGPLVDHVVSNYRSGHRSVIGGRQKSLASGQGVPVPRT